MEKQAHIIKFDEKGKPVALLYRTKEGYWVWMGIFEFDEDDQEELMKNHEPKIKSS
jgi:hypothetical protein